MGSFVKDKTVGTHKPFSCICQVKRIQNDYYFDVMLRRFGRNLYHREAAGTLQANLTLVMSHYSSTNRKKETVSRVELMINIISLS